MILFYVWTDTQIINAVNAKCNFYQNEEVDILVLHLSRISDEYISIIQNHGIFNNVYILNLPAWYLECKKKSIKELGQSLINGWRLRILFNKKLDEMISDRKYDLILSAAFWSETMHVFRYFRRKNLKLELGFIEEGLSFYSGPKGWLYNTSPSLSIKAKIREILYYGSLPQKAKKYIKYVFMYYPEISEYGENLVSFCLPPIIQLTNEICYSTLRQWRPYLNNEYINRTIFHIADAPRTQSENPYRYVYYLLDILLPIINPEKFVLRLHPLGNTWNIPFEYDLDSSIYLDTSKGNFELNGLYMDFSNKIFIINNSSLIYYLKMYFEMEPYIIFTHRLCRVNEYDEIGRNERFISTFIKIYSKQSKIAIPRNAAELADAIIRFSKEIDNN